jgi:hypothetical protein
MAMDGNWVEMTTMVCGTVGVFFKPVLRKTNNISPCWVTRVVVSDFLNAASLAPFVLLFASVFDSWVLDQLVKSGKGPLGLAGGIGAIYVLAELMAFARTD